MCIRDSQGGDVGVNGLKFPLFLVAEFQLFGPLGARCLGFGGLGGSGRLSGGPPGLQILLSLLHIWSNPIY